MNNPFHYSIKTNICHDDQVLSNLVVLEAQLHPHDAWSKQTIVETLNNSHVFVVLAYDTKNSELIGYAILSHLFEMAELYRIGTHFDYQRQGVADKIIQVAINYLTKNEVASIQLEVRADNEPAILLYQKIGFFEIHRRKEYYRQMNMKAIDAVIMELKLSKCTA